MRALKIKCKGNEKCSVLKKSKSNDFLVFQITTEEIYYVIFSIKVLNLLIFPLLFQLFHFSLYILPDWKTISFHDLPKYNFTKAKLDYFILPFSACVLKCNFSWSCKCDFSNETCFIKPLLVIYFWNFVLYAKFITQWDLYKCFIMMIFNINKYITDTF